MITFGLTGGICTGKSRISKLFIANDIPIIDADIVAREVITFGTEGYYKLFSSFHSYFNDGYLDRKRLADLIFFDNDARALLDSIMIPLIKNETQNKIESFHKAGNKVVGFDSALIVEWGDTNLYRPLITIYCAPELQIERMMRRNRLTMDEAVARLKAQLPAEEKIKVSDFVINSSGAKSETDDKVKDLIKIIKQLK
jgi:dephospho-CoA kinase